MLSRRLPPNPRGSTRSRRWRISPHPAHHLFARQHGVASLQQLQSTGRQPQPTSSRLEASRRHRSLINAAYRTPECPARRADPLCRRLPRPPDIVVAGPDRRTIVGIPAAPARSTDPCPRTTGEPSVDRCDGWCRTEPHAFHDRRRDPTPGRHQRHLTSPNGVRPRRWLSPDDLLSVIEQAIHDGRITDDEMYAVAVDWISLARALGADSTSSNSTDASQAAPPSLTPRCVVAARTRATPAYGVSSASTRSNSPATAPLGSTSPCPTLRWAIEVDVHPVHGETNGRLSDRRDDAAATPTAGRSPASTVRPTSSDFDATIARVADEHQTSTPSAIA